MHKLRKSDEEISQFCEQHGCKFLKHLAEKGRTRIAYLCKCGREAEAYWTNFRRFPNCKRCGAEKISGEKCHMYDPDREAVAMRKKFRKACGQMIRRCYKGIGGKKADPTTLILGYGPKDLQEHIEKHPDYRTGEDFHIDHVFPIQAFLDYGITDLKLINCLDNLRPMPGKENLSKADKYNKEEFEQWLLIQNS